MLFEDANGRQWALVFKIGLMIELRDSDNIDFLSLEDPGMVKIEIDEDAFLATLEALLSSQLKEKGLSIADVVADMDPEAYGRAKEGVRQALDFFYLKCGPEKHKIMTVMREKIPDLMDARIKDLDVDEISGNLSSDLPVTSESTPDLSATAS